MNKTGTVLVLAISMLSGCRATETAQTLATPVKVQAVRSYSPTAGVRYSANITPATQVDLAFHVGGYVEMIAQVRGVDGRMRDVQEGDYVEKGTVLARVRQIDYEVKVNHVQAQLNEARSSIATLTHQQAEAEASLAKARQDFDRAEKLLAMQSLTRVDYDAAKMQLDTAQARADTARSQLTVSEARIEGARALLDEANTALNDTELRAPVSGTVLERQLELGTFITQGKSAFVLADTTSVRAVFGVPDLELQNLSLGRPLTVTSEAVAGSQFHGQVSSIAPAADSRTRVFEAEITLSNPRNLLKPGMIASVHVEGPARVAEPFPVIPLSAIVRSKEHRDQYAVFVMEEKDEKEFAHIRNVKLGQAYGNLIVASEGVKVGERVITTGATLIVDGAEVRVIP